MRETIILAPGANGTELLRSLARHGVNTLCMRVMSSTELAETALMRSGKTTADTFIRSADEPALIFSFLNDISYFSSASFADAQNIAVALDTLRKLIIFDESTALHDKLAQGEFRENSMALGEVYDRYIAELKAHGLIDGIQLIRRAVENAEPINADFITLSEYPITPLEAVLTGVVSDGRYRQVSLRELFNVETGIVDYCDITEAYGAANEVEHIIDMILRNGTHFDEFVVAVTDTVQYSQLFYDLAGRYGLPVTFGCGIPLTNTTSAGLLRDLMKWETNGAHGRDALYDIIFSECFDRQKLIEDLAINDERQLRTLVDFVGTMRLSGSKAKNDSRLSAYLNSFPQNSELAETARLIAAQFERGISYIIKNYAVIRDGASGRIDRSAVKAVCDEIDAYTALSGGNAVDIIPQLLRKSVCSENSREGALHVTGIRQAMCSLRSRIFIAGLSADIFPGSPAENYLVPDGDFLLYDSAAPTSEAVINNRKKSLNDLITIASALKNTVHLSYSGYDTAELKESNASSQLFEIFRAKNGDTSTLDDLRNSVSRVGFFDDSFSAQRLIGRAYNSGDRIIGTAAERTAETTGSVSLDKSFSPSSIEAYFSCPRKYYFSKILRLEEPEEDDVFTVIGALDRGILIHDLMKDSAEQKWSKEELISEAERRFDAFLTSRPPVNVPDAVREREEIMQMVENGFDSRKGNTVEESECDIESVEFGGIKLQGRLDRLEETPDGQHVIVDFKTSRKITHVENDTASCMQVLLYAAMLEKSKGITVSGGEYRYLRDNRSVKCEYNDQIRNELEQMIEEFAYGVSSADFRRTEVKDNCRYCGFAGICKEVKSDD